MNKIKVEDIAIGSISINSINNIEPIQEFLVKGLASLQLLCLTTNDKYKLNEIIDILIKCNNDIKKIYIDIFNNQSIFNEYI